MPSRILSEKLRRRAETLGASTSDRHSGVSWRSSSGTWFQFDAADLSTEAFVVRFAEVLVAESEKLAHERAVDGLRTLLGVPTARSLDDAVERLEDRISEGRGDR